MTTLATDGRAVAFMESADPGNPADPRPETLVEHDIRLALGMEPDFTLWRNATGVATHVESGRMSGVRYGLVRGGADLIGILAPAGRLVALEVKNARGVLKEDQRRFLELVRRRGGFGCVVRSVEQAKAALGRARRGYPL